ncbi:1-acyl-sn-glycerol-3-phosphate acyltransferase [Diplodia corticola]|uniref:1-acyl-sn-glycerol-3-phosphate acyltransferase n=1 Tax=Diplodia corticola TaxID=236234 RepID=A0A1J9QXT6_9PEZI|nr:1-acyl-sn-glycerol-3-phosphate acyltransferase [Diplodia corticola]OJD33846.1 1-acyl-sn-glycerol-3-phosphate acyltransferase [Diplodia corticola]
MPRRDAPRLPQPPRSQPAASPPPAPTNDTMAVAPALATARFVHAAHALRGVAVLAPWLAYLLGVDLLLSLLLPLKTLAPTPVYNLSSVLAGGVWAWIQNIFTHVNHADIVLSTSCPAGLPRGESAVVIANHVAWADFYMIQEAARRTGMLGRCRWFAKRSLRWVPFLGWGLWAMGMPLVSRSWATDRAELERVFRGIVSNRWPVWLIAYSEGTRFTPARHSAAVSYRATTGKPPPPSPYLLVPRPRGFVATVTALRRGGADIVNSRSSSSNSPNNITHIPAVLDFTIAYARHGKFMAAPSFWDTVARPDLGEAGYRFYVHVRRWEMAELPEGEEALAGWLEERWVEKGRRLERLREVLEEGEGDSGDWGDWGEVRDGRWEGKEKEKGE